MSRQSMFYSPYLCAGMMAKAFRATTAGLDQESVQYRPSFSQCSRWWSSGGRRQSKLIFEYHSRGLAVLAQRAPEIQCVAGVGQNLIREFLDQHGFPFNIKVDGKKLVVAGDMEVDYGWLAKGEEVCIASGGQTYPAFQLLRHLPNFESIWEAWNVVGSKYPLICLITDRPDRTVWLMRHDGPINLEELLISAYTSRRMNRTDFLPVHFDEIVVPMIDFDSLLSAQFLKGMKVQGQEISQVCARISFRMSERGADVKGRSPSSSERFVFDGPFIACVEDIYCGPIAVGYFCPEDSWRQPFRKL